MSSLVEYNGIEAANLFLGQAGFDAFSGVTGVQTPSESKRWAGIQIIGDHISNNDIILTTSVGDDLTIAGAGVEDLLGTMIYGPFTSVDPGQHDIIMIRG